jgi:signal transduction histidine kinase
VTALLEAVMAVTSGLELADVLTRIVSSGRDLVGARYGAMGVLGLDGRHLAEFVTDGLSAVERSAIGAPPRGHGVLGLLISEPTPLRLSDLTSHPDSYGFPPNHPAMHSFLGVPIRIRDEVFGNLYMTEKIPPDVPPGGDAPSRVQFTASDKAVLVGLAAAAGIAIENARLFERTRRQRRWIETTAEVSRMLLEESGESTTVDYLSRSARGLATASMAMVVLVDERDRFVVRAVNTTPQTGAAASPHPEVDHDDLSRALRTLEGDPRWAAARGRRAPVLITPRPGDPVDDALVAALGRVGGGVEVGLVSLLPMAVADDEVGVLVVAWPARSEALVSEMLELLGPFTRQVAVALIAARNRRARSAVARLEDRDRIARDMHDHVIQRLFATGLSLQAASRTGDDLLLHQRLDEAVESLDEAIKDIRYAIFELHGRRPGTGVVDSLHDVVSLAGDSLGLTPELTVSGDVHDLGDTLAADLLAVVREALANVAKHAQAQSVTISVAAGRDLRVCISDDGTGIPPGGRRSGLANLAARATILGGTLSIRATASHGTTLVWRVPTTGPGEAPRRPR